MAATHRIRTLGRAVVQGDLVWLGTAEETGEDEEGEREGGGEQGCKEHVEGDKATTGVDNTKIKVVSAEEAAAGTFKMTDVVIPMVGTKIMLPTNSTGSYLQELLLKDGLKIADFGTAPPTYRLQGAYRHLVTMPGGFEYSVLKYSDPNAELADTEMKDLRQNQNNNHNNNNNNNNNDNNYNNRKEENSEEKGEIKEEKKEEKVEKKEEDKKELLAVRLQFVLRAGVYATMLLRELTKQSTGTVFQSKLTASSGGSSGKREWVEPQVTGAAGIGSEGGSKKARIDAD